MQSTNNDNDNLPVIPPRTQPIDPCPFNRNVAKCGQCGLILQQVMGYVCNHPNCPTGLSGTTIC